MTLVTFRVTDWGAMIVNRKAPLLTRPRFPHGPPVSGTEVHWRCFMPIVPVMWSVWIALRRVLCRACTCIARGSPSDEEDQIFLDDSFNHEEMPRQPSSPRSTRSSRFCGLPSGLRASPRWVWSAITSGISLTSSNKLAGLPFSPVGRCASQCRRNFLYIAADPDICTRR